MPPLTTIPRAWWGGAVLVLAALGWGYCAGRESTTNATADATVRTIRDTIRVRDTVIHRDTVRLRQVRAQSSARLDASEVTLPNAQAPDSIAPLTFVPRDTVDAVLASERAACDSAIRSLTRQVDWYRRLDTAQTVQLQSMDRRRWRDRIGLHVGYGMQLSDGVVRVGPQVGLSVRIF